MRHPAGSAVRGAARNLGFDLYVTLPFSAIGLKWSMIGPNIDFDVDRHIARRGNVLDE